MIRPLVCLPALALAAALVASAAAAPKVPMTERYGLVLLRSGARSPITRAQAESLQAGHMANIHRMFESGALDCAGPFGDRTPLRGIFVFESDSMAALTRLLAPDPLLASGRLVAEPYVWRADAGIGAGYRASAARPGGPKDSLVQFTMLLLSPAPNRDNREPPGERAKRARELSRQRAAGQLVLGGPIEDSAELFAVHIYAADSSAVVALAARDPGVQSGRLVAEVHPWWTAFGNVPGH